MPILAGNFDMRDNPQVQMQMAQGIGGAIGSGLRYGRIRQEEKRKEHRQTMLVDTLSQLVKNDVTDPAQIIEAVESIPGHAELDFYRQMMFAETQQRMMPDNKLYRGPDSHYYQRGATGFQKVPGMEEKPAAAPSPIYRQGQDGILRRIDPETNTATPVEGMGEAQMRIINVDGRPYAYNPATRAVEQIGGVDYSQEAKTSAVLYDFRLVNGKLVAGNRQTGEAKPVDVGADPATANRTAAGDQRVLTLWSQRTRVANELRTLEDDIREGRFYVDKKKVAVPDYARERLADLQSQLQIIDDQLRRSEYGRDVLSGRKNIHGSAMGDLEAMHRMMPPQAGTRPARPAAQPAQPATGSPPPTPEFAGIWPHLDDEQRRDILTAIANGWSYEDIREALDED